MGTIRNFFLGNITDDVSDDANNDLDDVNND